jgi:hypothetical protein
MRRKINELERKEIGRKNGTATVQRVQNPNTILDLNLFHVLSHVMTPIKDLASTDHRNLNNQIKSQN